MLRLFKALIFLAVLGLVALTGFAYFGDLTPERTDVRQPVTFDAE
jgi:hypothetical protein